MHRVIREIRQVFVRCDSFPVQPSTKPIACICRYKTVAWITPVQLNLITSYLIEENPTGSTARSWLESRLAKFCIGFQLNTHMT